MPGGIFLGSPDPEFARRATIETYEPDPIELEKTTSEWHNFWINILNKSENEITDEELDEYFPYYRDKVEYSKRCLIATAHCRTCSKIFAFRRCPKCPYRFEQFLIREEK